MYILISPAKKQQLQEIPYNLKLTSHDFGLQTQSLIQTLRSYSKEQVQGLMKISDKLADLNVSRFRSFDCDNYSKNNSCAAGWMFQGDVYKGLDVNSWSKQDCEYAQNHMAILSGLYGKLRFLDKIQYYRLEMKTKVVTDQGKNLYDFWGDSLSKAIDQDCKNNNIATIVNLASNEYSKVVNPKLIKAKWINVAFKEPGPKGLSVVAIRAKYARGLMSTYIIKNRIKNINDLMNFNCGGYQFNAEVSTENNLVFVRS